MWGSWKEVSAAPAALQIQIQRKLQYYFLFKLTNDDPGQRYA